jgi:hypothetical protein
MGKAIFAVENGSKFRSFKSSGRQDLTLKISPDIIEDFR